MTRPTDPGGARRAAAVAGALVVLLGALVSGAAVGVADAETTSVYVAGENGADGIEASPGETVTVTVGANASSVSAYQATLGFDPDVVQVESVSGAGEFDDPVSNVDNGNGSVAFNQLRSSNATDPQFATLTLRIVGDAGEEATLSFEESETKLSDDAARERSIDSYEGVTLSVASAGTETPTETETATATGTATPTESQTGGENEPAPEGESDESGDDNGGGDANDVNDGGDAVDSDDGNGDAGASNGGGSGGSGGGFSGPPRLASSSSMLIESADFETTFDGRSPTFAKLELRLDSEVSGTYAATEFERLPSNLASARDGGDVVTAFDVDPPDSSEATPGSVVLSLKRDSLDERNASVDRLRVERYDDSDEEWRTLDTEVVESNDETVTLRTESTELGWFVVSAAEGAQTESTPESSTRTATANATETPSAAAETADEPTAEEPSATEATASPSPTQSSETETGTPGFGLVTAVAAGAALLGYVRFRRR